MNAREKQNKLPAVSTGIKMDNKTLFVFGDQSELQTLFALKQDTKEPLLLVQHNKHPCTNSHSSLLQTQALFPPTDSEKSLDHKISQKETSCIRAPTHHEVCDRNYTRAT